MIRLINNLNKLYEKSKTLKVSGWDEQKKRTFRFSIDFKDRQFKDIKRLDDFDFAGLLWQAGLINFSILNDPEIEKLKKFLETPTNKAKCIALDSNIILYRFMENFINQYYYQVGSQFSGIIILPNACDHEFHFKTASTYHSTDSIINIIDSDKKIGSILCRTNKLDYINERIEQVKNYNGRLGLKGKREIRKLQEMWPVIISSPGHLYYSQKIQTEKNFIDAIFDSLIRIEINFFRKNTNADIIFLTGDKDQHGAAQTEGTESLWIRPVNKWEDYLEKDKSLFHLNKILELILELLVFSPYIKIEGDQLSHYYSFHWHNKTPKQNLDGIIRCFNGVEYLHLS
ncbi:MAG: hypothetical protein ACFFD2_15390 [Promethearchaeota archaeon]